MKQFIIVAKWGGFQYIRHQLDTPLSAHELDIMQQQMKSSSTQRIPTLYQYELRNVLESKRIVEEKK